jgi:hypothetical protein
VHHSGRKPALKASVMLLRTFTYLNLAKDYGGHGKVRKLLPVCGTLKVDP